MHDSHQNELRDPLHLMTSRKLRITFVIPRDDLSGGCRMVATYAKLLQRRGHTVKVVSGVPGQLAFHERIRAVWRGEWKHAFSFEKPLAGHATQPEVPLTTVARSTGFLPSELPDADVLIATWWIVAQWLDSMPQSKGVRIHFVQNYEIWGGSSDQVDAAYRINSPKITTTRWLEDLLRNEFGQKIVALVPNSVDLTLFNAPPRSKNGIPTVGFVYNYFKPKGCDIIAEAIDLARQQCPAFRVKCFASVNPTPNMPLPRNVEFHYRPPQTTIRDIYASCDAWLFGSRKDGFGLPLIEAMACRTPVIATPAGAAPELLLHGGGILVKPDARSMADAILAICDMPDSEWNVMSHAAFAAVSGYALEDACNLFETALLKATAN